MGLGKAVFSMIEKRPVPDPKTGLPCFPETSKKMPSNCSFSPESLAKYGIETRFACPNCFRDKLGKQLHESEMTKKEFIPKYELKEPEEEDLKPPFSNYPLIPAGGNLKLSNIIKNTAFRLDM